MTSIFFHLSGTYACLFYPYIMIEVHMYGTTSLLFSIECLGLIIDRMYVNASNDCNRSE